MALPGVTQTVLDGQLGVSSSTGGPPPVFFGASSLGTANTLYSFAKPSDVISTLGDGELVEALCHTLAIAGGSVHAFKTAASVAAANTAVAQTGGGPAVTVAGSATNHFSFVGTIVLGGALGTATFTYSLDGGKNTSAVLTVPAGGSYVIPGTGLTLTFPAGTYVADEVYTFTSTPATYNSSDLTAAITAAINANEVWSFAVFTGYSATASAAATLFSSIDTHMTSLANGFKYLRTLMSTGADAVNDVNTAFDAVSSRRIGLWYSRARIPTVNAKVGWGNPLLPFLYAVAARMAQIKASTSPGWVELGGLDGVTEPEFDERQAGESLHNHAINAPTTYIGRSGIYTTNGLLHSPAGSDFKYVQWGRITDIASLLTYQGVLPSTNSSPRTLTDGSGKIDPRDAARIDTRVQGKLDTGLIDPITDEGTKGYVSAVQFATDQTNDVLTSSIIQGDTRIVPRAQAERIITTIALTQQVGTTPTETEAAAA